MYANAPNASAATPLTSPQAQYLSQVHEGHPQGLPPAAQHGGSRGTMLHSTPSTHTGNRAFLARPQNAAAFVTGAYQASGDPAIDRMLRLEAACKRFGSPF